LGPEIACKSKNSDKENNLLCMQREETKEKIDSKLIISR